MRRTRILLRVRGIPVAVDASWAIIAALVLWTFWARFAEMPGDRGWVAAVQALAAAILFFGSLLGHELAHALEARRRGIEVRGITLYLFGGATEITGEIRRPGDEFALTAAGPWTSIVLGAACGLAAWGSGSAGLDRVAEVLGLVGWLNIFLGVFNLLPGVPLDGGRLLDSLVWRITRDRLRAARVSSGAGVAVGAVLVALGLAEALWVSGGFVGGLWLVLIGWFLVQGARGERRFAELRAVLSERTAGALVLPVTRVPVDASVAELTELWAHRHHLEAVLVEDRNGPVGVVTVDELRRRRRGAPRQPGAGGLMQPLGELASVPAGSPASDALAGLPRGPVLVTEDGRIIGVLTLRQLLAVGERFRELTEAGR